MANKVLLKKSSVIGKVPLTTDLDYGEIALNYADEKIYFKNTSDQIVSFAMSASGQSYSRSSFTATSNQTIFNVTYTVGYILVYINGVMLETSSYTASDGTTVVLNSGCVAGETVDIVMFGTVVPSLTGYATETYVTSRGYITSTDRLTANNRSVTLDTSGQTILPVTTQGGVTNAGWLTAAGSIVLNSNGNLWLFGQDGTLNSPYNVKITTSGLQFPDSSTQTTAWTGTAAAGTLTGTALPDAVVSSKLTSVGQLTNLQVAGGASVTNNAATDHYINLGTVGQIFDDGNFHIHAKTGNLWINALTSGDINLGYQYNSGTGTTVKVAGNLESKTAYKARTSWNAALNTEITLDNYRYRVTSSGGTYPQVISNISGTTVNSSWVSVATMSGTAIAQTGNTGILLPNNSWTSLFTNHGLDSPADMVVTTITDKAHGIVHRVTFIRNDDGSNTGYSIFAEKLW